MVNICSDIAEGMAYLHHHSPVRVIHCDLKPSNVLLNDDMIALVSDFGISRLVMTVGGNTPVIENMGDSTANLLSGTIGYIAPEYGFGSGTSIKGDVYSFGVLVLEMVTRKRPTDDMFTGGLSLHKWVKSNYQGRMEKIINSNMVRAIRNQSPEVKLTHLEGLYELFISKFVFSTLDLSMHLFKVNFTMKLTYQTILDDDSEVEGANVEAYNFDAKRSFVI